MDAAAVEPLARAGSRESIGDLRLRRRRQTTTRASGIGFPSNNAHKSRGSSRSSYSQSPAKGAILNRDFLDLLTAFNVADVRYMVVGAYAVAEHGRPLGLGGWTANLERESGA